jgi:integrase
MICIQNFAPSWQDIDFENNLIRVLGTNTKTERERLVPLSHRAKTEFEKLREITSCEKPFPFTFKEQMN